MHNLNVEASLPKGKYLGIEVPTRIANLRQTPGIGRGHVAEKLHPLVDGNPRGLLRERAATGRRIAGPFPTDDRDEGRERAELEEVTPGSSCLFPGSP